MGVRVKVLDPTPGCPAAAVAEHTLGSFRDPDMIRRAPGRTLHDCPHTYLRM
jgi:phosphoribosylaminoimidazole carboxylase (NCAIR synthetase)